MTAIPVGICQMLDSALEEEFCTPFTVIGWLDSD